MVLLMTKISPLVYNLHLVWYNFEVFKFSPQDNISCHFEEPCKINEPSYYAINTFAWIKRQQMSLLTKKWIINVLYNIFSLRNNGQLKLTHTFCSIGQYIFELKIKENRLFLFFFLDCNDYFGIQMFKYVPLPYIHAMIYTFTVFYMPFKAKIIHI